jgi:hypothetical protein
MDTSKRKHMRRWSDNDSELTFLIESLRFVTEENIERAMVELKDLIDAETPELINIHVEKFVLRRRWYDDNPYTWLVLNSLKYAPSKLLHKSKDCLGKYLRVLGFSWIKNPLPLKNTKIHPVK